MNLTRQYSVDLQGKNASKKRCPTEDAEKARDLSENTGGAFAAPKEGESR
jgi:hypothetical protein